MNLLYTAFSIASYIWLFDSKEKIFQFICDELMQLDICRAVIIIDECTEYYRIKDSRVLECEFLKYHPKTFSFVEKEMLISSPIMANSAIYVFLWKSDEEILQIFQDLFQVVRLACENLEFRKKREEIILVLKEILKHFQFLADKLRNPLAVIFGAIEVKDEIGADRAFFLVKEGAERIERILEELSDCETRFRNISRTIL
uniref:Signal transduction histidine kinase dimerisation/phosphoacceptor domain-containing protein n=1 Tax=Archaeoglobus fulgidus TaxID=2234 RepID=A0A7J2TKI3_ARCFL